jgi:hypothetical protein
MTIPGKAVMKRKKKKGKKKRKRVKKKGERVENSYVNNHPRY